MGIFQLIKYQTCLILQKGFIWQYSIKDPRRAGQGDFDWDGWRDRNFRNRKERFPKEGSGGEKEFYQMNNARFKLYSLIKSQADR